VLLTLVTALKIVKKQNFAHLNIILRFKIMNLVLIIVKFGNSNKILQMVRLYPQEVFKQVVIDYPLKLKYAVSTRGRLVSYSDSVENGNVLIGGTADGYKTLRYLIRNDAKVKSKTLFIFRLVAELFIPKTSEEQKYVLHLDYVRDNDSISNLKWATYDEMLAHGRRSPHVIEARRKLLELNIKSDGRKLTVTKVIYLKKLLKDPNRKTRLKMLAKQFGISEMQVSRIKTGENWGHIKV